MLKIPLFYRKFLATKQKKCNFCQGKKFTTWAKISFFRAVECESCGLVFINPFLNQKGLDIFYKNYFSNRKKDERYKRLRFEQYKIDKKFLLKNISKHKNLKIVDIGGGGGEFLSIFPKRFEKFLLEISSDAKNYAKKKYKINLINESLYETIIKNKFDVVMMRGVLEHFTDPRKALLKSIQILKKNGFLYITSTPNISSICAQVYRENWRLFNPLDHLYYFNVDMLEKLLKNIAKVKCVNYFYEETPYANPKKDNDYIIEDIKKIQKNIKIIRPSPPYHRNMMTVIFKKI